MLRLRLTGSSKASSLGHIVHWDLAGQGYRDV